MRKAKQKAIVVGGSIAGVSCGHALSCAGWEVVVVEKSGGPGSPTGAGLGLDPLACKIIHSWLPDSAPLYNSTIPLSIDQNNATDVDGKPNCTLTRDEDFNFRAAYWPDLHGLLLGSLPPEIFLWGHQFLSFCIAADKTSVTVTARVLQTGEIIEIMGDLLIAADGCLSSIRKKFLPDHKLRYTGYCAWRGVLDFTGNEDSETIRGIRQAYPDLGTCLYFDLGPRTHCVLYELLNKRMNWIWYINQPEPELKGNSVTMKVREDMIKKMHEEAERFWVPELAKLMKATPEPFLNVIYDSDPLERLVWDNVVLIGDAAHPTTPHCLRSTNMSLLDAAVLGKCLEKWGVEGLQSALAEYQSVRLPVVGKQVLHARRVGRIKQGLDLPDREPFDPKRATAEDCYCENKISRTLTRDEEYNFKSAHWANLHALLVAELPPEILLRGHQFLSICNAGDKGSPVTVKAKVLQTGEIIEFSGDLLIAADGSLSSIRQAFLPDLKLRYAGYCIWRGLLDFSENEDSDTYMGIRKAYPDLGKCLYYDLAVGSHCVLYELLGKRMNWGWYVNQPEPKTMGNSLTMKPSKEMIEKMHSEAEKVWVPELARLIRETEPFLNMIYDSDPLERILWDNIVLVGDAAHPITPHSARSTNASILDAAVLVKCLEKHAGLENLHSALSEYQSVRLPVIAKQVLHARRVGQIRQGVALPGREPFDPKKGNQEIYPEFQQRNAPFFSYVPELLLNLS